MRLDLDSVDPEQLAAAYRKKAAASRVQFPALGVEQDKHYLPDADVAILEAVLQPSIHEYDIYRVYAANVSRINFSR